MLKKIIFEGQNDAVAKSQVTEVIERLIDLTGCQTATELAHIIHVNPTMISAMRSGTTRLRKDHLEKVATSLAYSVEELCVRICTPKIKVASRSEQRMLEKRHAFLHYYRNAQISIDQLEEESIMQDGCVVPSLLTKIFAANRRECVDYLSHMQPLITNHRVRERHYEDIHALPEIEDEDLALTEENEEDVQLVTTDGDENPLKEALNDLDSAAPAKGHQQKNGNKRTFPQVHVSSDSDENIHKITCKTNLFQLGQIILTAAIREASDDTKETVSIATVRSSITKKIPNIDLRYDPHNIRITLIDADENVELATSEIPIGYVFVK